MASDFPADLNRLVASQEFGAWVGAQRWYPGRGSTPQLGFVASYPLGPRGVVALAQDTSDGALYQIPLAHVEADGTHVIGSWDDTLVVDGAHDVETCQALFRLATRETSVEGDGVVVRGRPVTGPDDRIPTAARVLSGEQSNTSVIVDFDDSSPAIVKIFRLVHAGENPDVTLQTAIARAGSDAVPRSLGAVEGEWGGARGHLAFAQEFLPGTRDAWRVALEAATANADFTERAGALGAATQEAHRILATALPTEEATPDRVAALVDGFLTRAEAAFAAVPELRTLAGRIEEVYAAARDEPWPRLQRIHGDYHLGQVLDAPGRGWVLLDFEGEPLRPMSERNEPDLALRDVAGMLRSFDYAAGSVALGDPSLRDRAAGWAADCRAAFLDGYGRAPLGANPRLLAALEIDKALYEAVYEFRNRPTWLPIPVTALTRLLP